MVAGGHPNKAIASVLNISSWTVCTYLRRIFAKLGVNSRAAMVARTSEIGWMREHTAPELRSRSNALEPIAPARNLLEAKVQKGAGSNLK